MSLEKLIKDIKKAHEEVGLAMRKSLDHAKKAGELLTKAKEEIDKGDLKWSFWVKNKCGITERMAANYLRIFKEWQKIEAKSRENGFDMADLTIRGALGLLKKRTRKAVRTTPLTLPRIASLMAQYQIDGEPQQLLEMLKELNINLKIASSEGTAVAEATSVGEAQSATS